MEPTELKEYVSRVARNMSLRSSVDVTYDGKIRYEGLVYFDEAQQTYRIRVKPRKNERDEKSTANHELGHVYAMERHPVLSNILLRARIPELYFNEFVTGNPHNPWPLVIATISLSVISLLSNDTALKISSYAGAVLLLPSATNEILAEYYGHKFRLK